MTQVVTKFMSADPRYDNRGNFWIVVSSVDGEDVYIPDLPDGYGEHERPEYLWAASTGVFLFTGARVHHLDLGSKKWSSFDFETQPGESIATRFKGGLTSHTHNNQEYISFVLAEQDPRAGRDRPSRIVDLDVASHTFSYTDLPSGMGRGEYIIYVNRSFLITEYDGSYSRADMSTPLLIDDSWDKELLRIYFDESGQLNLIYRSHEEGSGTGIFHEIQGDHGNHRTLVVPEEDYESGITIDVEALGISGSGNVYAVLFSDYDYQRSIRFYGSSGDLIKEIYVGDGQDSHSNGAAVVSDDGQYALFTLVSPWWSYAEFLLVDINGNYRNLISSLRNHFRDHYHEFYEPIFVPSQQENKPEPFWTLFKNTVEVH